MHSAHGPDEGGAARARCGAAAGRLRRVPPLLAAVQGRGARDRAADRGPRHRRDLHRPHRRARCRDATPRGEPASDAVAARARRRGASIKDAVRARDRAVVLDRRHAEQAALQDRLRARQARRPHAAAAGRTLPRASGRCRRARSTASARRRARGSTRSASAPSASSRTPIRSGSIEHFGAHYGAWLHEAAHGRDERPVVTYSEPKSISRETTFERDLHADARPRASSRAIFTDLCVGVAGDLERKGYVGKTIGLKLRYDNFRTVTRDRTIAAPTQDAQAIRRAAGECLKRVPLERRIRLLGVRVGALSSPPTRPRRCGTRRPIRRSSCSDASRSAAVANGRPFRAARPRQMKRPPGGGRSRGSYLSIRDGAGTVPQRWQAAAPARTATIGPESGPAGASASEERPPARS